MKVRFTRSIIAGGEHREVGSAAELDAHEAADRIASGDAIPVKFDIEDAEAKHPSRETATRKHK